MNIFDVQFFHSGGTLNNDPEADLGGAISTVQLSSGINNLFDTLSPSDSLNGRIDYRCFYILNNNSTDILRNVKLWIDSQKASGSYIEIGVQQNNEVQEISIDGTPNEDETLVLNIEGTDFTTTYNPNLSFWKEDFQNQIRTVNGLNDVIVELSGTVPSVVFTINFLGQATNKRFGLITVVTNNLTGTTINITEEIAGNPVNATASIIPTKLYAPTNVKFEFRGFGNPIKIGNLAPNDSFAVWAKRVVPSNTFKKTNDNFILGLSGGSV